jgi:hypothetical protein
MGPESQKATTELANVSGTELTDGDEAGDFKCLMGSTSSPVLEEGGVFLFWPRLGVSCLPSIFGRGRECVGYRDDERIGVWSNRMLGGT